MRLAHRIVISGIGLATLIGCEKKPHDKAEAMARVEAAIQISNPLERDKALSPICKAAASAGFGEAVVRGVVAIGDPLLRDDVDVECALKLRDSGQGAAANEVAKLVSDPIKRDNVLKRLSSGS